jgi:hypothetical protein
MMFYTSLEYWTSSHSVGKQVGNGNESARPMRRKKKEKRAAML